MIMTFSLPSISSRSAWALILAFTRVVRSVLRDLPP